MTIKKISSTLLLIVLLLAILASGIVTYFYYTTDETSVPVVALISNEKTVSPKNYVWHTSLFNGLLHRNFKKDYENGQYNIGTINSNHLDITPPEGYTAQIAIRNQEGIVVFSGDEIEYKEFKLQDNGTYTIAVVANRIKSFESESYGQFLFSISFELKMEPIIVTSNIKVTQGDVLAIKVKNLPNGVVPTAKTELGMSVFTNINGQFVAYVPVAYLRQTGKYSVLVSCENFSKEIEVEVVDGNFEKQYLTIDTSNPVISEASSPMAYTQFRNTIYPFYEIADKETYWNDKFIQPVQGRISTEYGLQRFTNGSKKPSGHSGIDIATETGTPIIVPAAGRVVFADKLLNTGNTLVIEHGGGLKSFFYHMNSLAVKQGDMVQMAQSVGEVGTTGYSTGPHLHYEVRIGNQSINPWNLFNGTGGFFELN